MKKLLVFLVIIIFLIAILYTGLYIFLNLKGKTLIINTITQKFQLKPELENFRFSFPFRVELKGFLCGDVSFSRAKINLVGANPLKTSLIFDNLYIENLKVKVERSKDKIVIQPFLKGESTPNSNQTGRNLLGIISSGLASNSRGSQNIGNKGSSSGRKISFTIKNALLRNASFQIIDTTFQPPMKLNFKDLNIRVKNFQYPGMNFYVDLTSSLLFKDRFMPDILDFKGWIDLRKKNMKAKLKINNYDYVAFSEYYPPFWKPDNLQLKEAALSLSADLDSQNNDLTIESVLTLEKIVFKDNPDDPSKIDSLKKIIALFKEGNGKPSFHLPPLKTKMDKLELDIASVGKEFQKKVNIGFVDTLKKIVGKTSRIIGGPVGEEIKKITFDPAIDTIKEILEGIESIIKSKKKEDPGND